MNKFSEAILIVDDEADIVELLSETLREVGQPVWGCLDMKSALEIITREQVFLMFCDYRLEKETGLELYEQAKKQNPSLTMILVTGHAEKKSVIEALRLGVTDVIEKPFNTKEIIELARRHTKIKKASWEKERQELEQIKAGFIEEASTLLTDIDQLIMSLEETQSSEDRHTAINKIYRAIHTIKGSTGAVPDAIMLPKILHKFESLLTFFRNCNHKPSANIIDLFLTCADCIKTLIQEIATSTETVGVFDALLQELIDTSEQLKNTPETVSEDIPLETKKTAAIKQIPTSNVETEIQVPHEKLDHLMEISGEMVAFQNNFDGIISRLIKKLPEESFELSDLNKVLSKMTTALQKQILDVRKVKAVRVTSGLQRIVRSLEKDLNKNIKLELEGNDVEMDKTIAHCLSTSLTHLIRNSCDHGIEAPEERLKNNKSRQGLIVLGVTEHQDNIEVNIRDDGRGLNQTLLLDKAIKKGLITKEQAANYTEAATYDLIFISGFSTSKVVSEVSGRGVGMDAVRTAITELGGQITITSELGKFTSVTLSIPKVKSINIEKLVICSSSGYLFALPMNSLDSIIKLEEKNSYKIGEKQMYSQGSKSIPFGSYMEILDRHKGITKAVKLHQAISANESQNTSSKLLAIIEHENKKVALQIDDLSSQIKTVIKPFDEKTGNWPGCKGIALLPQNKIALVIDEEALSVLF